MCQQHSVLVRPTGWGGAGALQLPLTCLMAQRPLVVLCQAAGHDGEMELFGRRRGAVYASHFTHHRRQHAPTRSMMWNSQPQAIVPLATARMRNMAVAAKRYFHLAIRQEADFADPTS